MLLSVFIPFVIKYSPNRYIYGLGGVGAIGNALASSFAASVLHTIDLYLFQTKRPRMTPEQRKFELANFIFVWYFILDIHQ
jgi:hypothetical protein